MSIDKLLVITDRFPHNYDDMSSIFIKMQIDKIHDFIKDISIIAYSIYIPKILLKINPFGPLPFKDALAENYCYNNIHVYYTKTVVLPRNILYKSVYIRAWKTAERIFLSNNMKPDLIHAHFIWPSGFIAKQFHDKYNIKYIITCHGHDAYDIPFRNNFYKTNTKCILDSSENIITVSNKLKEILVTNFDIASDKIFVIPNGFNEKEFYPIDIKDAREKLGLNINDKIILSIGRLSKEKGYNYLIYAAANLIIKNKADLKFIIIGDGPEKQNLAFQIKKLGLHNNVFLMGAKPHNELVYWINSCNLFVISSFIEGNPTVLFETLACGKPIIGTSVGGIPDIINSQDYGIIMPARDIEAISQTISDAIIKNWNSDKIITYAKQFEWKFISTKIHLLYLM